MARYEARMAPPRHVAYYNALMVCLIICFFLCLLWDVIRAYDSINLG